jgi:ribonuclease VapC
MIVVDTSALLSILQEEPDARTYAEAIAEADPALLSAASLAEAGIVMLNRHGLKGLGKLYRLVEEAGLRVESVTAEQARQAVEAYAAYGKGRKSGAALNYGDCFPYALAKATGLPLLFKGSDFERADVASAL